MNIFVLLSAWLLVLAAFAAVAVLRWQLGRREDDHLHFGATDGQLVNTQVSIAHKLDVLDRWKSALLVLTILTGLAIAAIHAYNVWQAGPAMT
jgi:hypothetical protein